MLTFIVFIISLVLLVLLFVMKRLEMTSGRKIFLEEFFLKCDAVIAGGLDRLRFWWSHVNFKNTHRIFSWLVINVRESAIAVKRRFDHQQSHFFIKRDHETSKGKSSVSFFLKDVSDYKKSLRKDREN